MTREEVLQICEEAREKGERANLAGVNLTCADLRRADLTFTDLTFADLTFADLRHANLDRANLTHADLTLANLTLANLTDRIIQVGPIVSRKDYICYNATLDEMRCGCFFGTLTDFEEQVRKIHRTTKHAREYFAMVRFLEEMREINKTAEEALEY